VAPRQLKYPLPFLSCCLLLLHILLLVALPAFTQSRDTLRKYLNDNLELTTRNKASYAALAIKESDHWLLYAVYPDNNPLLKMYFADKELSNRDGPFQLYYQNNKLAASGYYLNDQKNGVWRQWYENGQLNDSGLVANDQTAGGWKWWYENGGLYREIHFMEADSLPNSPGKFSPETKMPGLIGGHPKISILHGLWTEYHEKGSLKTKGQYRNGKKTGYWENSYPDGKKESQGHYEEDVQEGTWEYFHANGIISTREIYRQNKLTGMECYDEQGSKTSDFCSIQKPAVPLLEVHEDFNNYLLDHLFWPKELEGKEVNGMVKLDYTISKEGKLTQLNIRESPHELISKEVERFFHSISGWYPAVSHNRPIDFTAKMEIPFIR
jgi:antitoxin component YwqK of YwqJK toxin-antitoxin module